MAGERRQNGVLEYKEVNVSHDGQQHQQDEGLDEAAGHFFDDSNTQDDGYYQEYVITYIIHFLLEQLSEGGGDGRLKLHPLARHGMREAKQPGMQAQAMKRVVAVAVFRIATDRVTHIG